MSKDNADPKTGMERVNTNFGDPGFILKFEDGTVTYPQGKAKKFSWGPIDGDTRNPHVKNEPIPDAWQTATHPPLAPNAAWAEKGKRKARIVEVGWRHEGTTAMKSRLLIRQIDLHEP